MSTTTTTTLPSLTSTAPSLDLQQEEGSTTTTEFLCDDVRQLVISFLGQPLLQPTVNQITLLAPPDAATGGLKKKKPFPYLQNSLEVGVTAATPGLKTKKKDTRGGVPVNNNKVQSPTKPVVKKKKKSTSAVTVPSRKSSSVKSIAGSGREAVKVLLGNKKKKNKTEKEEDQSLGGAAPGGTQSEPPSPSTLTIGETERLAPLPPTPPQDALLNIQLVSHSWNRSFHRTWIEAEHVVVRRAIICNHRCHHPTALPLISTTTTTAGGTRRGHGDDSLLVQQDREKKNLEALQDLAELADLQREFLDANEVAVKTLEQSRAMWVGSGAYIDSLRKECFQEMKSYARPPQVVALVMRAVLILLRREPSWTEAKSAMLNPGFMDSLKHYPVEAVSPKLLRQVKRETIRPDFRYEHVVQVSSAAASFYQWVLAVVDYAEIGGTLSEHLSKSSRNRSHDALAQFSIANEIISLHELLEEKLQKQRDQKPSSSSKC